MQTLTVAPISLRWPSEWSCRAIIEQAPVAGADGWVAHQRSGGDGATLFVLYAVATEDAASSGVLRGFWNWIPGRRGHPAGGFSVRSLNTAATLWCSARSEWPPPRHLVFTWWHRSHRRCPSLGRPLGRLVDRDNAVEDERAQPYQVRVFVLKQRPMYVPAIVQRTSSNDITLRNLCARAAGTTTSR